MGVKTVTNKDGTISYWVQYFVNGRRVREVAKGARTLTQAKDYIEDRKHEIRHGKYQDRRENKPLQFKEFAKYYLELKELDGLRDMERVKLSMKYLAKYFGNYHLSGITKEDILRYRKIRQRTKRQRKPYKPIAPATINREMACLKNLLNVAIEKGLIDKNPMFRLKALEEDNIRDRCLSADEERRIQKVSPPHLLAIITCALETAMRKMEILNLTWDRVDLKKGFIFLRGSDTKTCKSRKIPISPILNKCLSNLPRSSKTKHVFLYEGRPFHEFTTSWNNVRRKAKIEDFRFHDFRHTFVQRMRKRGVHDHVIMAITGHTTREMFKRYDTVDDDDLTGAVHNKNGGAMSGAMSGSERSLSSWDAHA